MRTWVINPRNFRREEFDCKCCGWNNIKEEFVWRLQLARTEAKIPFIVLSGCRCREHNKAVGGAENSDHLTGEGADIKCNDARSRFLIIDAALKAGITRIGIAETFIHLGVARRNPQRVIWPYPKGEKR